MKIEDWLEKGSIVIVPNHRDKDISEDMKIEWNLPGDRAEGEVSHFIN